MTERVDICGIYFNNLNLEEATKYTIDKANGKIGNKFKFLLVANQDIYNHINKYKNINFENINYNFLNIPDGNSIIVASKFLKRRIYERVSGPDLMLKVLEKTQDSNIKHFFLGSTEKVLELLEEKLNKRFDKLNIAGFYSPPFGEWSEEENSKIINLVNNSNTTILWVSFGCPKQEWWILNNQDKINAKVIAGIGAAFDFISENKKRAPLYLQKLKLEWLYRIIQEPGRLWKRYFFGGINFLKLIIKEKRSLSKTHS